jgi:tetratricopeptide (TPR) repeat protein
VAATRDNLGLVYRQMNDIDKALEYHKRALQIRINEVGPSDLATAASKTAIANIHYQNEEYKEALELYNEVLTMQVEMLGNDHLDVAATLQNIGTVLKHSDLNQSWERFETSLAIIVGIYGHKHRSVADTLNNMGGVRYAQVLLTLSLQSICCNMLTLQYAHLSPLASQLLRPLNLSARNQA